MIQLLPLPRSPEAHTSLNSREIYSRLVLYPETEHIWSKCSPDGLLKLVLVRFLSDLLQKGYKLKKLELVVLIGNIARGKHMKLVTCSGDMN